MNTQIELKSQQLSARLNQLTQTEARLVQQANPLVRGISDWVAQARPFYDTYSNNLQQGRNYFAQGTAALQKGDDQQATRFLDQAEQFLAKAEFHFSTYIKVTRYGAERVLGVLKPVQNGGLAFTGLGATALTLGASLPVAGALAASGGFHAGLLSIPLFDSEPNASPQFTFDWKFQTSESEPTKETKPKPVLSADDQSIIPIEKILQAIDEPEQETQKLKRKFQLALQTIPKNPPSPAVVKPMAIKPVPAPVSLPTPNVSSEAELIGQAQQALREWQRDHQIVHPLGRFLLATQFFENQAYQEILKKWQQDINDHQIVMDPNPSAWQGNVNRLMHRLFGAGLGNYAKGQASLSLFLGGKGGNCEAETKWTLSAFAETALKFPESYRPAIQVFSDHLQPVVFDKKEGRVLSLMTNEWNNNIEAPLYDPHLFYYAYLKAKKVNTPVAEGDLLLAEPDWLSKVQALPRLIAKIFTGDWSRTNTNLEFPKAAVPFTLASVPERAVLPNPYTLIPGERAISRREWVKQMGIELDPFVRRLPAGQNGFSLSNSFGVLILGTDEQTAYYNQLPLKKKKDFLIDLDWQEFTEVENPFWERVLTLLSKPSEISNYDFTEIRTAIETQQSLSWFLVELGGKIARIFSEGSNSIAETDSLVSDLTTTHPLFNLYWEKKKRFEKRMSKNAISFILFADQLGKEKREFYIAWLDAAGGNPGYSDNVTRQAITKVISDPNLIGIKEETSNPKSQEVFELEFELIDAEPKETTPPQRQAHLISPETMMAFIFKYSDEKGVRARWNPLLSRKLFERHSTKEKDSWFYEFHSVYKELFKHYPKTKEWVKDPLEALDKFKISQMTLEEKRLWRKEMAQYPEEGKTSSEALIPPDFEPILYQILQGRLSRNEPKERERFLQIHPDIAKKIKQWNF